MKYIYNFLYEGISLYYILGVSKICSRLPFYNLMKSFEVIYGNKRVVEKYACGCWLLLFNSIVKMVKTEFV